MKLNLGCGRDKIKGYVNCDISKSVNPDRVVDLEKKLPFKDDSVEGIYCRHVVEHVENFLPLMKELWRISKNGAKIKIIVPYFSHPISFQDPTHKRFFTLKTFDYFSENNNYNYYTDIRFEIAYKKLTFINGKPFINSLMGSILKNKFYERFFSRILPAEDLEVLLIVKK